MKESEKDLSEMEFLDSYNPSDFPPQSVAVDLVVFKMSDDLNTLQVLLHKRDEHPFKGSWALSGGFVRNTESAYSAACRILNTKLGVSCGHVEQLYTMSQPNRDPRMRIFSIVYLVIVNNDSLDTLYKSDWFDITMSDSKLELYNRESNTSIKYNLVKNEYKNGVDITEGFEPIKETLGRKSSITYDYECCDLAFDHASIIIEAVSRLRGKLEYSDLAFNFVSTEFTMPDLKRVYEVILNKELFRGNFQGSVAGKVKLLDRKGSSVVGNKKSQLFIYRG